MDIDSAKKQAKALARALQALGVAHLENATALEVVARMNGFRNWSAAQRADGLGSWNAAQVAVHTYWCGERLNAPEPGQRYDGRATLYAAVMDVAGKEPLSRAIKTVEHWASIVQDLYDQAVQTPGPLAADPACKPGNAIRAADFPAARSALQAARTQLAYYYQMLPQATSKSRKSVAATLAPAFAQALDAQLVPDSLERVQRLQTVCEQLYCAALALRQLHPAACEKVLLLDSHNGSDCMLALGIPSGRSADEARNDAERVLEALCERSPNFSSAELLVRMAQLGYVPLETAFGPVWDGADE